MSTHNQLYSVLSVKCLSFFFSLRNRIASKYRQTVESSNCVVNERKKIADSKGKQSLCFENFLHAFVFLGVLESAAVIGFFFSRWSHRWTLPVKRLQILYASCMLTIKALVVKKKKPNRVQPNRALPIRRRLPVRLFPNKLPNKMSPVR